MHKAQELTYKEANKGLLKFKHTRRKESLKGLIKKPLKYDMKSDSYLMEVSQVSIAGKVLEFKGYHPGIQKTNNGIVSVHSGLISLSNPNQRRAHTWIRNSKLHRLTGATGMRLNPKSQVSPIGSHKNIKPMQDAVKNYLEKDGIDTIAKEIIRKLS